MFKQFQKGTMKGLSILLSAVCWLLFVGKLPASMFYVDVNSVNPTPPYSSWATAANNIQSAVDDSTNGDQIVVTNGIYQTGSRVTSDGVTDRVVVTNAVNIYSVNGPDVTWVNGGNSLRCIYLANGAVLNGFTLTNGNAGGGYGGAVYCDAPSIVLSNCILTGNSAGAGGGSCQGTINNSVFIGNKSPWGGATYLSTLNNCLLTNNSDAANFANLYGCTIKGNYGEPNSGYSVVYYCSLTNCNFQNNSGGYCCYRGTQVNCLLTANYGTVCGGSLLLNSTIIGNSTGLWDCVADNCIVYYNDAQGGVNFNADSVGELGPMMLINCCTFPDPAGLYGSTGNITNAPLFINLAGGDYHLQSNSPCINSGNNVYVATATDLDGNPRIQGGTVDIGVYEYQKPSSVLSYAWARQYGLPTDGTADYADSDGDGMNNYAEWIAGTNPTNAASVLLLASPSNSPAGITVTWQSVSGVTYYLQSSTNLPAFISIQSNIVGQAGTTSFTDTTATNGGPYFYRVSVQ